MNYKMADLSLMNKGSVYIPQSDMPSIHDRNKVEKVYAAYVSSMFRQYGVWIKSFKDIALEFNNQSIYFHESSHIPYFSNNGYSVKTVKGKTIVDFLSNVIEESYVIISVKDDASQQISIDVELDLKRLGISQMNKTKLRYSYLWVAKKNQGGEYDVLFEECSNDDIYWEGACDEIAVIAKSGGALAANNSSIKLGNLERSLNHRGFNVVVFQSDSNVSATYFDTFVTLFGEGSLFQADPPRKRKRNRVISRGGGRIQGINFTNCKEVFEQSYIHRGHRIFEADLTLTSDGELVARESWEPSMYNILQQKLPSELENVLPPTKEQFQNLKILNAYTPLTIEGLFEFLTAHPDAYLITDTKYSDHEIVRKQFENLVANAAPFGFQILMRVIPQLYSETMYDVIDEIFPFPQYMYTLYQTNATDREVISYVKEKDINFLALSQERYSPALVFAMKKRGTSIYAHTVNEMDAVSEYIEGQYDGFYTDVLSEYEVDREYVYYEKELETRKIMLNEFLNEKFGITDREIQITINELNLSEFKALSRQLFQCHTIEEINDLLDVELK
ncbi:interleukin-like EMT inducer domain-containing protein [Paenibacillus sinopodophylli]|uniref:interleukin-like EMT inducer domain-containing protein n=1 Tax=Paenibacillus sinopodophylli TaxID=1837342 RepID=UPI00110CAA7F|nr:interleukin-like EMT inducer domain-containing protein [Paenibacillus sinopodophylli]